MDRETQKPRIVGRWNLGSVQAKGSQQRNFTHFPALLIFFFFESLNNWNQETPGLVNISYEITLKTWTQFEITEGRQWYHSRVYISRYELLLWVWVHSCNSHQRLNALYLWGDCFLFCFKITWHSATDLFLFTFISIQWMLITTQKYSCHYFEMKINVQSEHFKMIDKSTVL